ncbi:hypothetical protein Golax_025822, partial [Gossypium laxum]|nr:hypothetical protein [Gossypium laxum]
ETLLRQLQLLILSLPLKDLIVLKWRIEGNVDSVVDVENKSIVFHHCVKSQLYQFLTEQDEDDKEHQLHFFFLSLSLKFEAKNKISWARVLASTLKIGKKARDLLYKDYQTDQKFTLTTSSPTGVAITSARTRKGDLFLVNVNTQLKFRNVTIDIKVDTSSNLFTTITVDEPAPVLNAIFGFRVPDQRSDKLQNSISYFNLHPSKLPSCFGFRRENVLLRMCLRYCWTCLFFRFCVYQIELQYLHEYVGISSSIGLTVNPIVNFLAVLGTNVIALGTDI